MVVDQQPKASSSKATTKSTTSKQTKAKKEPAPKKEKGELVVPSLPALLLLLQLYSSLRVSPHS